MPIRNRPGTIMKPEHILLYTTGNMNYGANAQFYSEYFKHVHTDKYWHYTVDDSNNTHRHIPDNEIADIDYKNTIMVMVCINRDGNIQTAVDNTINLIATLCYKYNIGIDCVDWCGTDRQLSKSGILCNLNMILHRISMMIRIKSYDNIQYLVNKLLEYHMISDERLWIIKLHNDKVLYTFVSNIIHLLDKS